MRLFVQAMYYHSSSLGIAVLLLCAAPPNVTAWPKEEVVNIHDSAHTVVYMCRAFGFPLPNVSHITTNCFLLNQMLPPPPPPPPPPQVTWLSEEVVLSGYCEGLLMEDTQGSGTLGDSLHVSLHMQLTDCCLS